MKIAPITLSILLTALTASAGESLTYSDLCDRMVDMQRLATPPVAGEKSGCFSSRDRKSRYDEGTGRYVEWPANHDQKGYVDDKGTMLKLDGPGVVWRIWSAQAKKGNLEFYIDKDADAAGATPTAAFPFIDMIKAPPFSDYPELVHIKAKGNNFFIPIPFNKSIVIRGGKDWGMYYQITYSTFPEGTKVPSFTGTFSESDKAALQKVNDIWGKRGPKMFASETAQVTKKSVSLGAGKEAVIAAFSKPGAITSIVLDRPQMDRKESIKILRELAISITWDDDKKPAVWAPLGDFFGTAAGENLLRTMATGMTTDGYYANWYMPFKKAKIAVRNDGKEKRDLSFTVHTEKVKGNVDQLLRFHCKWHRDDFSGFDKKRHFDDRYPDWPVLKVDGSKGRFCGFMAHMWNPFHIWNREHAAKYEKSPPAVGDSPRGSGVYRFYNLSGSKKFWWGEGDEKFFVDGEKMPSTFGTGSEDYFGYAWGTAQAFDSALQAQPRNGAADEIGKLADRAGPGNVGHISNVRWQIADNVPFQKSFEATVEKYHLNSWPLLNAYCAAWYQEAGKEDYYGPVMPVEERSDYYIPAKLKKNED